MTRSSEFEPIKVEIQRTDTGWCMSSYGSPCVKPAEFAMRIKGSRLLGDLDIVTTCRDHLSHYTAKWDVDIDEQLAKDPFWGL